MFGVVRRDLKACRVVCKKWNLRSIPHMRAAFKITIHGNISICGTNEDDRRIDNFVKLFGSNELGIPFESFRLGLFRTTEGVGQHFLQLCGETAKEIDPPINGRPFDTYTIEDVSELLRSCPNIKVLGFPNRFISRSPSGSVVKLFPDSMPTLSSLEKITFQPFGYGFDKPREYYASVMVKLITAAPNIAEITLKDIEKCSGADNDDDASKISVVLNCIEKLRRESSIQSFHFLNASIRHIEQLQRMSEKQNGLKLKNLTFKPHLNTNEDFGPCNIQLATIFKDTLQSFTVERIPENNLIGFPLMPNLKSLAFIFRAHPPSAPKPTNLTRKFPALERLAIEFQNGLRPGLWSQFFTQFDSITTIKSLSVRGVNTQLSTFCDIQRVFPYLTKLDFRVGNHSEEILREIWSGMTELKSLSIFIDARRRRELSLDSLFTGIPTQAFEGIRSFLIECGFDGMTVQQKRETILKLMEQHSQLPCIRNLTKLRHLDLEVNQVNKVHWGSKIFFTDLTVYLALLLDSSPPSECPT